MIKNSSDEFQIEALLSDLDVLHAIEDLEKHDSITALQNLVMKHTLDRSGKKIKSQHPSRITKELIKRYILAVEAMEEVTGSYNSDDFDEVVAMFWASLKRRAAMKELKKQQILYKIDISNVKLKQADCQLIAEKLREAIKLDLSFAQQARDALKGLEKTIEVLNEISLRDFSFASRYERINWEETTKCYCEWAQYGWTIAWNASPGLYMTFPSSQQEANTMALEYVDNQYVSSLFSQLRDQFKADQDFDSALFCYENKRFKACSLILCTIIERVLITFDNNEDKKIGLKAILKIAKLGKYDAINTTSDIQYLFAYNTLTFLNMLFKSADNFKSQPEWLNRNFLLHGMYNKEVTAIDCIKLFLGLFNSRKLLNRINQQK